MADNKYENDRNPNQHLPVFVLTGEADLGEDEGGRAGAVGDDGGVPRPDADERGAGAAEEGPAPRVDVELHPAAHPAGVPVPPGRPGGARRRGGEGDQGHHDRRLRC